MHQKFIATIIAAALSVTAFGAAPARAGDNDLAKALAAIAGIAIVGKVIHDRNERKREQVSRDVYVPPVQRVERYQRIEPRPLPRRANRRLLPGDCLRSIQTRDGRARFFGQRCLERNYKHVNKLPRACAVRFRGHNGPRRGYDARCLRNNGYQLARR